MLHFFNFYNNLHYWLIKRLTFAISINCYHLETVNCYLNLLNETSRHLSSLNRYKVPLD